VRFINGLANFTLKNQAKSHRAQKGYNITLVELQNFLNDVVTDSPELGGMRLKLAHLQHMETDNPLGSATLTTHSLELLKSGSAMVVAVVEAVAVEAIKVEVVVNHLQTLAVLTSAQSLMQ
jgi:hypothetical protein